MSDVKRWKETESWGFTEWDCMAVMEECDNGDYVLYSDYARLKAEVERLRASSFVTAVPSEEYEKLKAEVEELTHDANEADQQYEHAISRVRRLEAEVERLYQAGDWMYNAVILNSELEMDKAMTAWNAAKEGKPSV